MLAASWPQAALYFVFILNSESPRAAWIHVVLILVIGGVGVCLVGRACACVSGCIIQVGAQQSSIAVFGQSGEPYAVDPPTRSIRLIARARP